MYELVRLIPAFPLLGFLIIGLFGKYLKKEVIIGTIASAAIGASFVVTFLIFLSLLGDKQPRNPYVLFEWIKAGNFSVNISYQVDRLSIFFSMFVTFVAFLIHVYSIGYMHGDRSYYRFFAYLNLFVFMMLNLVLSSNFLLTFLGWEGVGLCSYLLIGFWYDKKFDGYKITWTGDAGNKAFIVNRIGDFGFLIAMFLIYITFNQGLEYNAISNAAAVGANLYFDTGILTAITLLLFLGCTGKSAQIPLAVWLPDAMAGPTPVSALIHAATMVTAGVFLIARTSVLFSLAPITMNIVAIVGIITAFWAATIGLVQNDFKKVLAYSTVSQLGFMFAALGVGAFSAGVFHVMTHAFFKGLLFLGAGAVIHGMHDEQNIKRMGGLKQYMPVTYITFLIATLAISGIPLFAGFFSKDEILWSAFAKGNFLLWLILVVAAFFTAFYMFRLVYLVFYGKERFDHHKLHPHEAPKTMTIPLIILAFLSAFGGFLGVPEALGGWFSHHSNLVHSWLSPVFEQAASIIEAHKTVIKEPAHSLEYIFMLISVVIAVGAIYLARNFYSDEKLTKPGKLASNFKPAYSLLWNKYFLDNIYHSVIVNPVLFVSRTFLWKFFDARIIDGFVNGSAKVTTQAGEIVRKLQTGLAQNYALLMLAGIIVIIALMAFAV